MNDIFMVQDDCSKAKKITIQLDISYDFAERSMARS